MTDIPSPKDIVARLREMLAQRLDLTSNIDAQEVRAGNETWRLSDALIAMKQAYELGRAEGESLRAQPAIDEGLVVTVAKALCVHEGANWDAASCGETAAGNEPAEQRQGFCDQARVAIQAALRTSAAGGTRDDVIEECVQAIGDIGGIGPMRDDCCMETRDAIEEATVRTLRALKSTQGGKEE